jgi:hypothetical protein
MTRSILAVLREKAAMKCEPETVKSVTQEGVTAVFKPNPYDSTQCDRCRQHKPTVRSRRVIEIGMQTGTVRAKFCDECAAAIAKELKGTSADATALSADAEGTREAESQAAAAQKTRTARSRDDKPKRDGDRSMQPMKTAIMAIAALALSSFLASNYKSYARSYAADPVVPRSPEIRRAIPVEPEVRRAILVQTREPKVDRRSESIHGKASR